jgi:hypothetical protein
MSKEDIIRKIYNDPLQGFTGINKIYQKVKQLGITQKEVKDFLKKTGSRANHA